MSDAMEAASATVGGAFGPEEELVFVENHKFLVFLEEVLRPEEYTLQQGLPSDSTTATV